MKNEIIQGLNELSEAINAHYGYVKLAGSNFGEPVINSGPCGPFANVFFHEWNKRFSEKVTISFVMDTTNGECHHVLIRLPNGLLYDGGTGVHDESYYDARFKIEDMKVYDYQLLDERAYGLNRTYPRFCPDFKLQELLELIVAHLDKI
ncbi:MAG: hypothetical protein JSR17_13655 [Proteobacteria bacterium]|nr:hypothetical protein [Pseudomonadota bacterium]